MKAEEKIGYKKQMKLYEKLGASWFQKAVFLLEKTEYKIVKKINPKFLEKQDKRWEKRQKQLIKNAKTEEERKEINRKINCAKLRTHRDFNNSKNRNYHIDNNNPTEIYSYLEWNKQVHIRGLVKNGIAITVATLGIILAPEVLTPYFIAVLTYEGISTFINLECVNLQNYNICRYKIIEDKLIERENRKIALEIKEYKDAAELVNNQLQEKEKIPTFDEIIDSTTTKEQLEQLKNVLKREKIRRNSEQQKILAKRIN